MSVAVLSVFSPAGRRWRQPDEGVRSPEIRASCTMHFSLTNSKKPDSGFVCSCAKLIDCIYTGKSRSGGSLQHDMENQASDNIPGVMTCFKSSVGSIKTVKPQYY
ncbi:hypothetical protein H4S14_001171 [Agrobacterium vitis]|nr:hypothetical protein [Agrobacterium vitis]MBE1437440.1 hypothetical protein [Agrobacterium vitis]